jgi:hypothetical protein
MVSSKEEPVESNKKTARAAGVLYLLLALGSFFSFAVRGQLVVAGDMAETLRRIASSETLFRLAIVGDLIGQIAFALMAPLLYWLFKPVDRVKATALAILILVPVPIALSALQNLYAVLQLVHGSVELQTQAVTLLNAHAGAIIVAQFFWGLWLIPFGLLVWQSHFLPKVLGVLLVLGSVGYLLKSTADILFPGNRALDSIVSVCIIVSSVAEVAMVLWLLIVGRKETVQQAHA